MKKLLYYSMLKFSTISESNDNCNSDPNVQGLLAVKIVKKIEKVSYVPCGLMCCSYYLSIISGMI